MSSESVNEGLVVAPEMKQSEGLDLDTSNNHHDRAAEGVKKEQSSEWPSSEHNIKSGKDDLTLAQLSKAAPRSPSPSSTVSLSTLSLICVCVRACVFSFFSLNFVG